MNNFVVWLDSKEARIFELKTTGIEKSHLDKKGIDHHRKHKNDIHTDSDAEHFYRDLSTALKAADQLLILGPGLTKNHFKTHLESHHTTALAKKIIGLETIENVDDEKIMQKAREFFKHYDLFN